ncbi:conserved membrane hypothetical protein [Burkholderiales bacterium]|nr:conserved membrane hypothetical protein [Burkholderiales bacterium]
MASVAQPMDGMPGAPSRAWYHTEDVWAIVLGVGLVAAAVLALAAGGSIKWLAVAPQKWSSFEELGQQLLRNAPRYLALFALWLALFGGSTRALGIRSAQFLPAFALLFLASMGIIALGAWSQAERYNLEPPLVALAIGLLISNSIVLPRWLDAGFRVEYYVKTGIVLLGATLPLTLIVSAGPVAILQAGVVSLVTYAVIFFVATRLGLDRRLAATLGAGGAVCGVSAAIAVAGAVGAKKEHGPIAITIVIFWAIVMIFVLPLVARALQLPTGVAGAWIGTSEFADAAGFAAAQSYGAYAGAVPGISGSADAAVNAFTLMKVIGRDLWIGIWAFVLSIVAVTRWEATGIESRAGAGEIWRRFPKFVIGFAITSTIISLLTSAYGSAEYGKLLKPELVNPIKNLRTWAFTFCFLSIGLTTRWRELASAGARPFLAFSSGVVVNVVLGFVLSTMVFGAYWAALGTP